MRTRCIAALLLSLAGTTMAQQSPDHLADRTRRRQFDGLSHIEVELSRKNALIIGFDSFAQLSARQNVDSLLRLFVADYQRIADTTQNPVQPARLLYRLGLNSRTIDVGYAPQPTTTFRFNGKQSAPVLVKTRQDTLQLVWSSEVRPSYSFAIYLLVNNVSDIYELIQRGGVNANVQRALEAVRNYEGHDLSDPRMAFNLIMSATGTPRFIHPGLAKAPYISLHLLGIGAGLIRNQWVPSINPSLEFVPNRLRGAGYSVSYLSNFFFNNAPDGRILMQRNDFVTLGVSFYRRNSVRGGTDFTRFRAGFSVGLSTYRSGGYFNANSIRLSGEIALSNLIRLQPELYMNGFFKQVFPGLRVAVGL